MAGVNNNNNTVLCRCRIVIAWFVINFLTTTSARSMNCQNISLKQEHRNKVLTTHYIGLYLANSNYLCALRCMKTYGCLSLTYRLEIRGCLLHNIDSSSVNPDDFIDAEGCMYSDFAEWNMKNVCDGNTCAEDEMCFPIGSRYVCKKSSNQVCRRNSTVLDCAEVHIGHNLFEIGLSQYNSTENETP